MIGLNCNGNVNYFVEFIMSTLLPVIAVLYAYSSFKRGKKNLLLQIDDLTPINEILTLQD